MSIRVVLVDPNHPGNIGAVARAMKNMGLNELHLVRPKAFLMRRRPRGRRAQTMCWMPPGCIRNSMTRSPTAVSWSAPVPASAI